MCNCNNLLLYNPLLCVLKIEHPDITSYKTIIKHPQAIEFTIKVQSLKCLWLFFHYTNMMKCMKMLTVYIMNYYNECTSNMYEFYRKKWP